MTKRLVAFRNFANALKNECCFTLIPNCLLASMFCRVCERERERERDRKVYCNDSVSCIDYVASSLNELNITMEPWRKDMNGGTEIL
jgi:hypothetical protein